jgi:hypothetical protein
MAGIDSGILPASGVLNFGEDDPDQPSSFSGSSNELEVGLPEPSMGRAGRKERCTRPGGFPRPDLGWVAGTQQGRDTKREHPPASGEQGSPLFNGGTTRTPETIESYRKRGANLMKRYRREMDLGNAPKVDALGFGLWFLAFSKGQKPGTLRPYRQAAIMILQSLPSGSPEEATNLLYWLEQRDVSFAASQAAAAPSDRITSALKEKGFHLDDFDTVNAWLRISSRSKFSPRLRDWLRAGIATGLRPEEWRATEIYPDPDEAHPKGTRRFLLVYDLDAGTARAKAVVRTLEITDFTPGTFDAVRRMQAYGARLHSEGIFTQTLGECSQLLYRACDAVWKKPRRVYGLTSCRHQFFINQAVLETPRTEIAAMLGCLITRDEVQEAGMQKSAWVATKIVDRPKAAPDEAAMIGRALHMLDERSDLLARSQPDQKAKPKRSPRKRASE